MTALMLAIALLAVLTAPAPAIAATDVRVATMARDVTDAVRKQRVKKPAPRPPRARRQ